VDVHLDLWWSDFEWECPFIGKLGIYELAVVGCSKDSELLHVPQAGARVGDKILGPRANGLVFFMLKFSRTNCQQISERSSHGRDSDDIPDQHLPPVVKHYDPNVLLGDLQFQQLALVRDCRILRLDIHDAALVRASSA
jgi:hypothetical protein